MRIKYRWKWYRCVKSKRVIDLSEIYTFSKGKTYKSWEKGLIDDSGLLYDCSYWDEETFNEFFRHLNKGARFSIHP